MDIISGEKLHKCESSDDGFHDLEVIEISDTKHGMVYVLLQCNACKHFYEGNLRKRFNVAV
jgi:hypothetical protein